MLRREIKRDKRGTEGQGAVTALDRTARDDLAEKAVCGQAPEGGEGAALMLKHPAVGNVKRAFGDMEGILWVRRYWRRETSPFSEKYLLLKS